MSDQSPGYQRFFAELKRRRVFRVMAVYGAVGFAGMCRFGSSDQHSHEYTDEEQRNPSVSDL